MRTNLNGWDVNTAQKQLRKVYEENFSRLVSALADVETERLSYPQMMDISAHGYSAAEIKILIVGKETRHWYRDASHDGKWSSIKKHAAADAVGKLLDCYGTFELGDGMHNRPFWGYSHKLYGALNPLGPANGFIWSNLIKMAEDKEGELGRPRQAIEERLSKSFDVLALEVQMAQPDVVIFFTGPTYDESLELKFPRSLSAVPGSGFDCRWLSRVAHDLLPMHSYRTYHPRYLNCQPNGYSVVEKISALVLRK